MQNPLALLHEKQSSPAGDVTVCCIAALFGSLKSRNAAVEFCSVMPIIVKHEQYLI